MERKKVDEIILPYQKGIPITPCVVPGDRILWAVEIMVNKNLRSIAVVQNNRPVGMLRLEDAFSVLGISMPEKL